MIKKYGFNFELWLKKFSLDMKKAFKFLEFSLIALIIWEKNK